MVNIPRSYEKHVDAIVHISPSVCRETSGLGILCGNYVFTCAHFYDDLPLIFNDMRLFDVTRVWNGEKGVFYHVFRKSTDVMLLAPD